MWTVELNIQTETQNIKAILNGDLKGHFSKCYLKHDCKKPDQMNPGYPKNCAVPTKKFEQKWLWRSYRGLWRSCRGLDGAAVYGSGDVEGSKYSLRGAVDGSGEAVEDCRGAIECF